MKIYQKLFSLQWPLSYFDVAFFITPFSEYNLKLQLKGPRFTNLYHFLRVFYLWKQVITQQKSDFWLNANPVQDNNRFCREPATQTMTVGNSFWKRGVS